MYIYRILRFLGLSEFLPLKLIHITTSIVATFLGERQAQMKNVEPSIGTSKRSWGEAFTTATVSGTMPTIEETFVDPTTVMDPSGGVDDVDPTIAPLLSLRAMIKSFMTTQAAHWQLLDELLMEVASLKAEICGV